MIRSADAADQIPAPPPRLVPSKTRGKEIARAPLHFHPPAPAPARRPPRSAWTHVRTGNTGGWWHWQTGRPRHGHLPLLPPLTGFCHRRGILLIESLGFWSELSSPVTLRLPPLPPRCAGGVPAGGRGALRPEPSRLWLFKRPCRPPIDGHRAERSSCFLHFYCPEFSHFSWPLLLLAAIAGDARVAVSQILSPDRIAGFLKVFLWATEGAQTMDVEAKQDASCSIKKTLRCFIRVSWTYASEHRGLFSLALPLYLLYKSSPGFFAFLLSSSPVIICTAILLGTLLSYGIKGLPEMDEGEKALSDNSAPKFESYSRNVHMEAYERFSVPAVKENIIREASFDRRDSNKHLDLDESTPLLKGVYQGDDRVDAAGGRLGKMHTSVLSTETMQQEIGDDGKDTTVREVVDAMTEPNHQGRVFTELQNVEAGDVSEHKVADGDAGKRRWGRAFSVRQRKKLADIKIEAINPAVDNQLDYSLLSPFTRAGSHDCSSGFDPDNAERYSLDFPMIKTASVPDATETDPLLAADFSCPDPTNNDNSENHSNVCSQDSGTDSGSIDVDDNSKAKEDGEEKDAGNDPAFLWTADDEKNAMDLGYSEIERNRRLEISMARRKSRKHMSFELDGSGIANDVSSFRPQALAISARRLNPFADDAEIPGSAPSVLHQRKNPFDFLSEQSNDSDVVTARHDLNPQELTPAPHQDTLFKRHESFNFGRPQQRHVPRFKPCFVLEEFNFDEATASNLQRQFSDRSVSRLSVVSECDTVSSVGDPEHNEAIRNYIRGVRESPSLLRQDSDLVYAGNECSDGISFGDNETLNAIIC